MHDAGEEWTTPVLDLLLRHPGWADSDVAAAAGVNVGVVTRVRRRLGLAPATKHAGGKIRRRVYAGRMAALEAELGAVVTRVGRRPASGDYYEPVKRQRDSSPRRTRAPSSPKLAS
jgi:hypothetical protein